MADEKKVETATPTHDAHAKEAAKPATEEVKK